MHILSIATHIVSLGIYICNLAFLSLQRKLNKKRLADNIR